MIARQEKGRQQGWQPKYPLGESNPCLLDENQVSWATRRRGLVRGAYLSRQLTPVKEASGTA